MATSTCSRYLAIVIALALTLAFLPWVAQPMAHAQVLNPSFTVDPVTDGVWGGDFVAGGTVTLSRGGDSCSTTADGAGGFWFDLHGCVGGWIDVVAGDTVTVSDGVTTKSHVVTSLAVTGVDETADTVSGTADPGTAVQVWSHQGGTTINVVADSAGGWTADFAGQSDLVPGTSGNAHQYDADNDATNADWHVSNPYIGASVIHDEIWAFDFPEDPLGQTLYYRLDDPTTPEIDFEYDMPLIINSWGGTEAGDRSFGRYDVQAGQVLTVRNRPFDQSLDGGVERVLSISDIAVTGVDGDADKITGYADPAQGPTICVWSQDSQLCSTDSIGFTWVATDWTADFGAVGSDVKPGHWNSASQYEEDGDETHYWWNLPPWVVVELAQEDISGDPLWPDAVRAEQWIGPVVTLEINGEAVADWTVTGDGHYTFELPGMDIDPGAIVTLSDSVDTKTVIVEPLYIDRINYSGDTPPNTVEGTANPHRDVRVEASATVGGWWAERWVNADSSGGFTANFGIPGNGWREQWTAELGGAEGLGRHMRLEIYDEDNDRVEARTCEGVPRIEVARSDGRVDAYDFAEGSTVTLEITGSSGDYTDTAVATRNPDNPCETVATFDLGDYEIPDDATVSATAPTGDGTTTTTVTHTVIFFSIDTVDPDSDTVSGTAAAGQQILVEADGNWRYPVACDGTADYPCAGAPEGTWIADFSTPGSEPGEEQVIDLGPGSSGRAITLDEFGNTTELSWHISAAQFQVDPSSENLWGNEWQPNSSVTVTVNGVAVPGSPFDTDEWGNFGTGFDPSELDLAAPDYVVVTDGTTTKDHTIAGLTVDSVDPVTNVVSGTAGASSDVWVNIHNDPGNTGRTVTANEFGAWSTDFDDPGDEGGTWDLQAGDNGQAQQCDGDNDCTNIDWHIAAAQFQVDPSSENLWGNEWQPNGSVTVTVNNEAVPGSPFETDEWGNFGTGFDRTVLDLAASDYVVVTDGVTTKTHTVTTLTVTDVDADLDVVSGMAEPGSTVDVWEHQNGNNVTVVACDNDANPCDGGDEVGTWHADFTGLFDVQPGDNGNSGQCDTDNDCTNAGWWVRNPTFSVRVDEQQVHGYTWPDGAVVTLTIGDHYTDTAVAGPAEWDPEQTFVWFEIPEDVSLAPGVFVTMSDGETTKNHWVAGLAVTDLGVVDDLVSGTATAGAQVDVGINDENGTWRMSFADGDGNWTADFGHPWQSEPEWDLVPGTSGEANEFDEDGDTTVRHWSIPYPSLTIEKTVADDFGNEGDGLGVLTGEMVTWNYVITNDGDVDLTDVAVTDVPLGDVCTLDLLDQGESATCMAVGTAEAGWHHNTGTATVEFIDAAGDVTTVEHSDDSSYYGLAPSAVTNSSLCDFGGEFDLVFTPDMQNWPGHFKLSASTPGQFYLNVFTVGNSGTVELEIPYPFVTQGAMPAHVYSGTFVVADSDTADCFEPLEELGSHGVGFALDDYTDTNDDGIVGFGDAYTVEVPVGEGFHYVSLHLDYGLEKTNGWERTGDDARNDAEVNVALAGIDILDLTALEFSASADGAPIAGSTFTLSGHNEFKNVKGFGGLVLQDLEAVVGAEVELLNSSGELIETMTTDENGWYLSEYVHNGKESEYTLLLEGHSQEQTITVGKSVKFGEVNFFL